MTEAVRTILAESIKADQGVDLDALIAKLDKAVAENKGAMLKKREVMAVSVALIALFAIAEEAVA